MKFLIVLAVVATGALARPHIEGGAERSERYRSACIAELQLTPEQQEHATSFDSDDPLTPKCYTQCLLRQVGLYDNDGFVFDAMVKHMAGHKQDLDAEKVKQDFELCVDTHKDEADKCDNAYAVAKCLAVIYTPPRPQH